MLKSPAELLALRNSCAETMLHLYKNANAGHIGASLSCLEILTDLTFNRMSSEDLLILSKGHAAAALYTVLAASGRLPADQLESFYKDGTYLAAHPPCSGAFPSIPFGTGSLGHGLSLAAGLAFSQRFTARQFHVYSVLSDGDCNEGSTWEGALFAGHHKLSNLTVIIDANGIQGFGRTRDILDLEPLADKWAAFGFDVETAAQGNDFSSLNDAFGKLNTRNQSSRPRCIVARTTKGHGVSYMQDRMEWHYLPMNQDQYEKALKDTGGQNA